MKDSKLFVCYSIPLKEYLSKNNIKYELVGLSPTTKKMFWVYIKNDILSMYLNKWKEESLN